MRLLDMTAQDAAGAPLKIQLSRQEVRQVVFDILEANTLCSIATVTPDVRAHINTAYFCYSDDLELYFLSHPRSVHSQNLSMNPAMAAAIFSSLQQWAAADAGVQLFGTCMEAQGAEAEKAEKLYGKRFSEYTNWNQTRTGFSVEYRFYRFLVLKLKVVDEAKIGDGVFVSARILRDSVLSH